jgi:predicted transcriptional regulator YdeE
LSASRQQSFVARAVLANSALVGLGVLLAVISVGASSMQPRIVEQHEFQVIGILARTSNSKEMSGQGVIGGQWRKFFKDGILDKIPNKVDSTIYAVYTGYESNRNGEYDFVIGARVSSTADVPPGMIVRKVPKGRYAVVTTAKGPVEQVVPQTWQRVWDLEDRKQLGGTRAYKTDFEVYDERSRDPKNSQVDLRVGGK